MADDPKKTSEYGDVPDLAPPGLLAWQACQVVPRASSNDPVVNPPRQANNNTAK